jgi:hypothetical protein
MPIIEARDPRSNFERFHTMQLEAHSPQAIELSSEKRRKLNNLLTFTCCLLGEEEAVGRVKLRASSPAMTLFGNCCYRSVTQQTGASGDQLLLARALRSITFNGYLQ